MRSTNRRLVGYLLLAVGLVAFAGSGAYADGFFGFGKGERGSGDITTEVRNVDAFDRIELEGGIDLEINIGEPISVKVSIDDNLQGNVIVRNRGRRTLHIETESMRRTHRKSKIEITVPSLVSLRIAGSGDIDIVGMDQRGFEIDIDGSGDVKVTGKVEEVYIGINGSGDVDTRELESQVAEVRINGSGDVSVYASEEFIGRVNGSGDITVYGDPKEFRRYIGGSGDIARR